MPLEVSQALGDLHDGRLSLPGAPHEILDAEIVDLAALAVIAKRDAKEVWSETLGAIATTRHQHRVRGSIVAPHSNLPPDLVAHLAASPQGVVRPRVGARLGGRPHTAGDLDARRDA